MFDLYDFTKLYKCMLLCMLWSQYMVLNYVKLPTIHGTQLAH